MTATSSTTTTTTTTSTLQAQLESLQDADTYASAWAAALAAAASTEGHPSLKWGGRGRGGRGRARRTWQPTTIVVEPLSLTYLRTADGSPARPLLEDAVWKLHPSHVYALVARNGAGKSSLLQHAHAKTLTGFPPHVSTFLVSQQGREMLSPSGQQQTVQEYLHRVYDAFAAQSAVAQHHAVTQLEAAMEALDVETAEGQDEMESLTEQLATLDEASTRTPLLEKDVRNALDFMGLDTTTTSARCDNLVTRPLRELSPGQFQKVRLAAVLLCPSQLLLFDEPTQQLDISGLWRLRRLIQFCQEEEKRTIVLVSHDLDLVNDVATDVMDWRKQKLHYYAGNYTDYERQRHQATTQHQRQVATVTRKKQAVKETLQHLKEQNPSRRRGGAKKKAKQLSAQRHKMSRLTADEQAVQAQLEDDDGYWDKDIQFVFKNPTSQWNEPLILAYGLGHGYGNIAAASNGDDDDVFAPIVEENGQVKIQKKEGFLFDFVDLCIEEKGTYAILGPSASGKTTLLRLLAGLEKPLEGEVKHALNVDIAYVDNEFTAQRDSDSMTTLEYLMRRFPQKTEREIRGEMSNFGLGAALTSTRLAFLSGGERSRLQLTSLWLTEPDVLLWDDPSAHLDPASVLALIRGLRTWQGTLVVVSHDTFLLRELEASCWALVPEEGKLRRVTGGVDEYVRSFAKEMTDT